MVTGKPRSVRDPAAAAEFRYVLRGREMSSHSFNLPLILGLLMTSSFPGVLVGIAGVDIKEVADMMMEMTQHDQLKMEMDSLRST